MKYKIFATLLASTLLAAASGSRASDDRTGLISINPSASPTGLEVAFTADFDGPASPTRIWVINLDGSNLHKIPTKSQIDEEPAWAPSGQAIAFASTQGNGTDIWTAGSDGSRLTQLTSSQLHNRQPAWSPDSRRIAFVSDRAGANEVWIMNADGTGQARLTKVAGEKSKPSFSPDGQSIVFAVSTGTVSRLATVNADGTAFQYITTDGFQDWNPSWGKSGILFSTNRDTSSEHWKIWRVQPGGTPAKVSDILAVDPVWTPNGQILYTDETVGGNALGAVTQFDPVSGKKSRITQVDGYVTPIDVRPLWKENWVFPSSLGTVPVAILSTPGFKPVTDVNKSTLRFGKTGQETSFKWCSIIQLDLNHDGVPDLVCRFSIRTSGFSAGDKTAILRFKDNRGVAKEGRDRVITSLKDDPDDFLTN